MSVFSNKFFSVAGQKERLANVGNTLKSAVTLRGVQSNTGNKVVDTVLSSAASNPYLTALPVASAKLIAGKSAIVAGSSAIKAGTISTAGKTLLSSGALKTAGLVGAGLIGASLLRSGSTSQTQQPNMNTNPFQEVGQTQDNQTNPYQSGELGDSWSDIQGDYNTVYQNRYLRQEQPVIFQPNQTAQPIQQTVPSQTLGQTSSTENILKYVLIGTGVYLILKKTKR